MVVMAILLWFYHTMICIYFQSILSHVALHGADLTVDNDTLQPMSFHSLLRIMCTDC